jgi:hypothetical protein
MKIFNCKKCEKIFDNQINYLNHLRWKHTINAKQDLSKKTKKRFNDIFGVKKEFKVCCNKCQTTFSVIEREKQFPLKTKYFCSRKCANTRNHSQKTKDKIKKSIIHSESFKKFCKERKLPLLTKICKICGITFQSKSYSKAKCCSSKCASSAPKPNNGGLRDGGGCSKVFEYVSPIAGPMKLNKDEIEVAKCFDNLKLNWKRNWNGFPYIDLLGRNRKYYPDFYVSDFDCYVEYKGWIDDKNSHKMNNALVKNNFKLLIIYSNSKRYKNLGLNLESLKANNTLLLNNLESLSSRIETGLQNQSLG